MIWGLLIGLIVGGSFGVILGGLLSGADDRDEYAEAVEELGNALRESYAWIHATGEWDDFEATGYTIEPPSATAISDGERRAERAARARARYFGGDGVERDRPLGHVRVGIDHPKQRP